MATPVLIIGRSGTGKSTSLRNCVGNDNWNLIRVLDKPLPFKGKINGWYSDDYQQIMKLLIASKAKNIVIDDAGYLITNMFMNKHSSAGGGNGVFTLYNQIGDHFWNLQDVSKHVPHDQGVLEGSGLSNSDTKAVNGKYIMRWSTPYAQYLWNGDVMYGNPTSRTYGPKRISFTSALAHEEWAKYAREVYGEQWKKVYQAALKRRIK